jgi:hypothetical protein
MTFVSIHKQKQSATFLQNARNLLYILNVLPEILLQWEYETKFRELHLVRQIPQDTVYYSTAIVSVVTFVTLSYSINSTQENDFTDHIYKIAYFLSVKSL